MVTKIELLLTFLLLFCFFFSLEATGINSCRNAFKTVTNIDYLYTRIFKCFGDLFKLIFNVIMKHVNIVSARNVNLYAECPA